MPRKIVTVTDDGNSSSISDARTTLSVRPDVFVRFVASPLRTETDLDNVRRLLRSAAPERRWKIVSQEEA